MCKVLATLLYVFLAAGLQADVTFCEDFAHYTGVEQGKEPLLGTWKAWSGNRPRLEARFKNGTKPQAVLTNGVISYKLPEPITEQFELAVSLLHTSYGRIQWFGLFNADGTRGYKVTWDSTDASNNRGMGVLSLERVMIDDGQRLTFLSKGPSLIRPTLPMPDEASQTRRAVEPPFLKVELKWTSGGAISLLTDGKIVARINDSEEKPGDFQRLLLSGNSDGVFDEVNLTGK